MSRTVIHLEDVSLCYRLAKQRVASFKEYFIHLVKGALTYEQLWALQDINLSIESGEVVGIIGPNGAGKSTLAKVMARVLKPQRGRCRIEGMVSPILELGTGFDYELTGRENVYLNAMLLGRLRREIDEAFDAIVDFTGLGEFIDTPVRNYSSGMLARLGFAIATAWIPDVLILDEVLAVGDARFLARCHERLETFRAAGTTIVLISHSPQTVLEYSTRCLWIQRGRLVGDGKPQEILDRYLAEIQRPDGAAFVPAAAPSEA